jgi:hypothetical protein
MTLSPLRTASTPPANPSEVLAALAPLATILTSLSLIAAAPAAAQPVPRVPVPLVNSFAARQAEICGTGGSGPFSTNGCVVPRTAGCPAFRLKINPGTGEVSTSRLEPGHILLQLDEWERFKRTNPGGR